jgi:hypothetical protein
VEITLKYFYTGIYSDPKINNKTTIDIEKLRSPLQMQVLTYICADKYDVPQLMDLAGKKFKSTFNRNPKPTPEEYLSVVSDVYTIPSSANTLRTIAVEYARVKIRDMMQSADGESMRATLEAVPEFSFDVLQHFANAPLMGQCLSCGPNQSAELLQARCLKCGKGGVH